MWKIQPLLIPKYYARQSDNQISKVIITLPCVTFYHRNVLSTAYLKIRVEFTKKQHKNVDIIEIDGTQF